MKKPIYSIETSAMDYSGAISSKVSIFRGITPTRENGGIKLRVYEIKSGTGRYLRALRMQTALYFRKVQS